MKRKSSLIVTVSLLALLSAAPLQAAQLQRWSDVGYGDLYGMFSKERGVECVHFNRITMALLSPFIWISGIDGLRIKTLTVMDLSEASREVKEDFRLLVNEIDDDSFETMVRVNDAGEQVKVLIRQNEDTIREFLVVTTGSDACLVRIRGSFSIEEVSRLAFQQR